MEEEKAVTKHADARLVRAVRKLKSNVSSSNNNTNYNDKNFTKTISDKNLLLFPNDCSDKNIIQSKKKFKIIFNKYSRKYWRKQKINE